MEYILLQQPIKILKHKIHYVLFLFDTSFVISFYFFIFYITVFSSDKPFFLYPLLFCIEAQF